jgi:hypothetical protein
MQRFRYLAIGFIIAIALAFAADRVATRGEGLAAAADVGSGLAAPLAIIVPPSLNFVAVTPCRVADTRGNGFTGQYGPPSIGSGGVRTFTIAGQCGISASATAVSFNFTILDMSTAGDIRVFPAGAATPLVSTQNWTGSTSAIANAATTPLGTGGAVTVQIDGLGGVNLIIDVNGYYIPLSSVSGTYFASPTECQRWGSVPYLDTATEHPPFNSYGPSIRISNTAAGSYEFYCPVSITVPPGTTALTLTGATMAFFDNSTNCRVAAALHTKAFGTNAGGTLQALVYDGASASDFAFTSPGPTTKAFVPFNATLSPDALIFVRATIENQASSGGDCRYSGVQINYTVDRP